MSFEKDLVKMHEEDNNKHALQWFINDIKESKNKHCLDKEVVRQAIQGLKDKDHEALGWLVERLTPLGLQEVAVIMINKLGNNKNKCFPAFKEEIR